MCINTNVANIMTARIKNKYKPDKVQVAAYVSKEVRDTFLKKCNSKGASGSTTIRQFVMEYISEQ